MRIEWEAGKGFFSVEAVLIKGMCMNIPWEGRGVDKKNSLLYLHRNNGFSIHTCGEIKESMLTFEGGGK